MSGGGGSSSGEIAYPDYMETKHEDWLGDVDSAMETARSGSSPYSGWTTVNPATVFGNMALTPTDALGALSATDPASAFGDVYGDMAGADITVPSMSNGDIEAAVTAQSNLLTSEATRKFIPAFEAGMTTANAVHSSAFVVGEALIAGDIAKKVAEFDADLRTRQFSLAIEAAKAKIAQVSNKREAAAKVVSLVVEQAKSTAALAIEAAKDYTAASLEVDKAELEAGVKDRTFDLSVFQYGNGVMSSIAGAASYQKQDGLSATIGGMASMAGLAAMLFMRS